MSTVRQLATQMTIGRVLPSIKFFEPKKKFLEWAKEAFMGRLVYDIGAGCGHVAKALSELGLEVKAIDINHREGGSGFPIEISNAEAYAYKPGSIAMICRPCHGEFAEQVIFKAWKCGVSAVVYVGLKKNFRNDLGPHFSSFKPALKNAGEEGETVLVWERIFPYVPEGS